MGWKFPRFRLRTLLLAIALLATVLGAGIWYFTPRISLRLIPDRAAWGGDEYPGGVVEIANHAPRAHAIYYVSESVIGLDLIVTDASGAVVSAGPYWFLESALTSGPPRCILKSGATHPVPVRLLRTVSSWPMKPGTYTIEAVYDSGGVSARSEKVAIQILPRPSP